MTTNKNLTNIIMEGQEGVLVTYTVVPSGSVSFPCISRADFDFIASQEAIPEVIKEIFRKQLKTCKNQGNSYNRNRFYCKK